MANVTQTSLRRGRGLSLLLLSISMFLQGSSALLLMVLHAAAEDEEAVLTASRDVSSEPAAAGEASPSGPADVGEASGR